MQGIGAKSFKKKASGRPPSFATPAKESNANWLKNSAIDKKLRGMIVSGAASKNMDIREIRAFQASNQEFARFNEKVFQTHYKELLTGMILIYFIISSLSSNGFIRCCRSKHLFLLYLIFFF